MKLGAIWKGLTIVAAFTLTISGASVSPALADGEVAEKAVFSTGSGSGSDDIVQHLEWLITGAEGGSTISIASYRFAGDFAGRIKRALFEARADGVHVQVLVDKGAKGSNEYSELNTYLDWGDEDPDSWVEECPGGGGDDNSDGTSCMGIHKMHNKIYMFSKTRGSENVVVQSTENLSEELWWNSSYTVPNAALYDHYVGYFKKMREGKKEPDFFNEPGGHEVIGSKYEVYHSPRNPEGPGPSNTVVNILNNVECFGNTSGGTGGDYPNRTIVRVSMWAIEGATGAAIANKLWDLDNDGCYVDIVADEIGQDESDPGQPLNLLLRKPEPCPEAGNCHGPEVKEFYGGSNDPGLHEKNVLIDGKYNGDRNQKIVFTGSVNFNNKSLVENDETWLRIESAAMHADFLEHFYKVKEAAHLSWQSSKAPDPQYDEV